MRFKIWSFMGNARLWIWESLYLLLKFGTNVAPMLSFHHTRCFLCDLSVESKVGMLACLSASVAAYVGRVTHWVSGRHLEGSSNLVRNGDVGAEQASILHRWILRGADIAQCSSIWAPLRIGIHTKTCSNNFLQKTCCLIVHVQDERFLSSLSKC